jgi:hypothetical protein
VTPYLAAFIRGANGVFAVIDDEGHEPIGVERVETLPDRVRVWHAPQARIHYADAGEDETYTRNGITAGGSFALDHVDVFFARNGAPITPAAACQSWSNVALIGLGVPA